jgi:hypothetical protein
MYSFDDLVKKCDFIQSEVLPDITCACYNKGKSVIRSCKKCGGTGLIKNEKYPHDGKCKAGHFSTNKRFWMISGRVVKEELRGVYCNDCMLVVAEMVRRKKMKKRMNDNG